MRLNDAVAERIKEGLATINGNMARQVAKNVITDEARREALGRIAQATSLDALAAKFLSSAAYLRSSVYDEAKALAETLGAAAKPYLKVMEKVANSSEEYLAKERKR